MKPSGYVQLTTFYFQHKMTNENKSHRVSIVLGDLNKSPNIGLWLTKPHKF